MFLSRLFIRNFRSIQEADIKFGKGKNVIIGRNNSGKSNIVKAIDILLGESAPAYHKSENIGLSDFHCISSEDNGARVDTYAEEIMLWCELTREPTEALDYDELYKAFGFYIANSRLSHAAIPTLFESIFSIDQDSLSSREKTYINSKLRNQQKLESEFDAKYRFAIAFRATRDLDEHIIKECRFLYRESDQHDWVMAFSAPIRNELLQSAVIQSFRDPSLQLRPTKWNWYGKLLRKVTEGKENADQLKEAFALVKKAGDEIFSTIKEQVSESSIEVAFPDTELHFQFNADSANDLYKSCHIYVDDGFKSPLSEKGAGIQSATIIGLFSFYTQTYNSVGSSLFCLEEPELYLHPHARRTISDKLDDFLKSDNNQVILTTHSAEFIRSTDDRLHVIFANKDANGTSIRSANVTTLKDFFVDERFGELFFAQKVILCEGDEEYLIRVVSDHFFAGKLNRQNVSIVRVGGKSNFHTVTKLVRHLGIKCFILADFDYLLRDQNEEGKQYGKKTLQLSAQSLPASFFDQGLLSPTEATDVIESIKTIRNKIKEKEAEAFYTAKRKDQIKSVDVSPLLLKIQKAGFCLLESEIENLILDEELLGAKGKVSLETAFKVSRHLREKKPLDQIVNVDTLKSFLEVVFAA